MAKKKTALDNPNGQLERGKTKFWNLKEDFHPQNFKGRVIAIWTDDYGHTRYVVRDDQEYGRFSLPPHAVIDQTLDKFISDNPDDYHRILLEFVYLGKTLDTKSGKGHNWLIGIAETAS